MQNLPPPRPVTRDRRTPCPGSISTGCPNRQPCLMNAPKPGAVAACHRAARHPRAGATAGPHGLPRGSSAPPRIFVLMTVAQRAELVGGLSNPRDGAVDVCGELLLCAAFRSQTLTFRVIQAHPGDDDLRDTVRLHPGAFGPLALRPGGQVLLSWGGQRMAVRALEDQKPFDGEPSSHVMKSVGLRLAAAPLPSDFPAHLIARVPAPVAGLVVAAAALPEARGWPLLLGGILAVVLGLAPLRMPRPPRGPWP
jgi:hypothetical protein